jgi:hypothetical protein
VLSALLHEFTAMDWKSAAKGKVRPFGTSDFKADIDDLVVAARDERADAMGEILSQDIEFISDFMGVLSITPGSHPKTYRVLHIASLIGSFAALYFKGAYERPRPSQLCPALLPPIPVPGHSSFPSGHSTQAHLMARCITHMLVVVPDSDAISADLRVLAKRVARNREIAGLHYASDSKGGDALAESVFDTLINNTNTNLMRFNNAITEAQAEWLSVEARGEWQP